MTAPITLFLVDDHDVVRRGLRAYAEVRHDIVVVGEASDGEEAIARIDALAAAGAEPAVVLMDLALPGMDGAAATAALLCHHPRLRVLVLTSFGGQQRVQLALAAGAAGYLLKNADVDEIGDAILAVARGEVHLGAEAAAHLTGEQGGLGALTPRELEVLGLLGEGCSNQEIGRRLTITERTARTHVSNLLGKLNLGSRTQAALLAHQEGLHPPQRFLTPVST
ncbi:MAG TPA: response regulator transcription factor [Trebonia sp.]|jgi:DNA-binding NarL/FixJ family response regulator|nr:response regulator transcription factor [Trebonia sp.]